MKNKNIILSISFLTFLGFPSLRTIAQSEEKITISTFGYNKKPPSKILNPNLSSDSTFSTLNSYKTYNFRPNLIRHSGISRYIPLSLNYNLSENFKLSQNLYLTPYNRLTTQISIGYYKNIGASLLWKPSNKLSIEGSSFLSKQYGYILSSSNVAYGYNLRINYNLTNDLQVSMYGQYMINNSKDPFLNYHNAIPKTSTGMSLQYNLKKNTKVGISSEYQYDERDRKWKWESKSVFSLGF